MLLAQVVLVDVHQAVEADRIAAHRSAASASGGRAASSPFFNSRSSSTISHRSAWFSMRNVWTGWPPARPAPGVTSMAPWSHALCRSHSRRISSVGRPSAISSCSTCTTSAVRHLPQNPDERVRTRSGDSRRAFADHVFHSSLPRVALSMSSS